jgi:hypothetical protein
MTKFRDQVALSVLLLGGAVACSQTPPTVPTPVTPPVSAVEPAGSIDIGTLTFENLANNGAPISEYRERGFVLKLTGADWMEGLTYGNPAPYVFFKVDKGASSTGTLEVSGGGQSFTFASVDLYSSTTRIPYKIVGLRGGSTVFTMEGEVPNTFGKFRGVPSASSEAIDTLRISLTNTAAPCCSNPMGLDNIVLR